MKGRRMKSSRLSSDIAHPVSRTTLLLSMQWGYPVSCPWPAVSDRISVVERGRVRDADDQSLARQKPNYGLAPGLLARRVKELEARAFELLASRCHRVGVLDFELDTRLRNGQLRRPRCCAEARLRSVG